MDENEVYDSMIQSKGFAYTDDKIRDDVTHYRDRIHVARSARGQFAHRWGCEPRSSIKGDCVNGPGARRWPAAHRSDCAKRGCALTASVGIKSKKRGRVHFLEDGSEPAPALRNDLP